MRFRGHPGVQSEMPALRLDGRATAYLSGTPAPSDRGSTQATLWHEQTAVKNPLKGSGGDEDRVIRGIPDTGCFLIERRNGGSS